MIMARLACWPRFVASAIALAIIVPGCREELGPEVFPTTRVNGTVVEGGSAVGGGWIEFVPVEGTRGRIRSARIQPDGRFQADRVSIGKNAIRLVNAPIQLRGGRELFGNYATTPLRRLIPAQSGGPMKIDVLEEALRYQAQRSRMTAGRTKEAAAGAEP